MRSVYYVGSATRMYREALEACHNGSAVDTMEKEWQDELADLTSRGYTTGFYFHGNANEMQERPQHSTGRSQRFLGLILENGPDDRMKVRAYNRIQAGQTAEIMSFLRKNDRPCTVVEILNTDGERVEKTGAGEVVHVRANRKGQPNETLRTV